MRNPRGKKIKNNLDVLKGIFKVRTLISKSFNQVHFFFPNSASLEFLACRYLLKELKEQQTSR